MTHGLDFMGGTQMQKTKLQPLRQMILLTAVLSACAPSLSAQPTATALPSQTATPEPTLTPSVTVTPFVPQELDSDGFPIFAEGAMSRNEHIEIGYSQGFINSLGVLKITLPPENLENFRHAFIGFIMWDAGGWEYKSLGSDDVDNLDLLKELNALGSKVPLRNWVKGDELFGAKTELQIFFVKGGEEYQTLLDHYNSIRAVSIYHIDIPLHGNLYSNPIFVYLDGQNLVSVIGVNESVLTKASKYPILTVTQLLNETVRTVGYLISSKSAYPHYHLTNEVDNARIRLFYRSDILGTCKIAEAYLDRDYERAAEEFEECSALFIE